MNDILDRRPCAKGAIGCSYEVKMPRSKRGRSNDREVSSPGVHLPRGVLARLNVGQSFAEYDPALLDSYVYVDTPAINAALNPESGKFFFVGRRGTGKTALRTYCLSQGQHFGVIVPEIFAPSSAIFDLQALSNSRRGPFRTLVSAFKRTLIDELLILWTGNHSVSDLPEELAEELNGPGSEDFDERTLKYLAAVARAVQSGDDSAIAAANQPLKFLLNASKSLRSSSSSYTLLIDSIDDYWDGSDLALIYLTAFIHACLEVSTQIPWARTLLLLRENIFERVRARDPESSRVETSLSGLDWTESQLLELVERRLNRALTAKFALGGPTWNAFFEDSNESYSEIFEYCHNRPRDILIYVSHAIDMANERNHQRIELEDVDSARRRFSDNRFKDLGDEYAENFPQIGLVLQRFYGLGQRYTPGGIESFMRKLLKDREVTKLCSSWIYDYQQMVQFVRLLYNIGFVGFKKPGLPPQFRALGPQETSPPAVSDVDEIVIHKCYWDALDLQDVLVRDVPEDSEFGDVGVLYDLPGGLNPVSYSEGLEDLLRRLDAIREGVEGAPDFEDAVGQLIKLCFFRALENVEPRSRDVDGVVIRDWIASNRAQTGFWSIMRQRYDATQVIWECKNYRNLKAADFQQVAYYTSDPGGRMVVIAFRGEMQPSYFGHIKRFANDRNGLILPLGIKDLKTFVRQNLSGKITESHIQDRYDQVIRKIS
jgi:hypothetical protein